MTLSLSGSDDRAVLLRVSLLKSLYFAAHFLSPSPHFNIFFLFLFFLLMVAPLAYGTSQARDGIGAAAAGLHHSHEGSEPHLRLTWQLVATLDP